MSENPGKDRSANRLSRIETRWSLIRRAHDDDDDTVVDARQQLLMQYAPAIRRYLGAALKDDEAADDVFQEFALAFSRGDFKGADPERGKFRHYIKTSLYHQIAAFYRKKKRHQHSTLEESAIEGTIDSTIDNAIAEAEEELRIAWRTELLDTSWQRLEDYSRENQTGHYSVLRMRAENPHWKSEELAARLSEALKKPMTPGATRTLLHRARNHFANCLLDALTHSLETDALDELEEELAELRLADYCKEVISDRRKQQTHE